MILSRSRSSLQIVFILHQSDGPDTSENTHAVFQYHSLLLLLLLLPHSCSFLSFIIYECLPPSLSPIVKHLNLLLPSNLEGFFGIPQECLPRTWLCEGDFSPFLGYIYPNDLPYVTQSTEFLCVMRTFKIHWLLSLLIEDALYLWLTLGFGQWTVR